MPGQMSHMCPCLSLRHLLLLLLPLRDGLCVVARSFVCSRTPLLASFPPLPSLARSSSPLFSFLFFSFTFVFDLPLAFLSLCPSCSCVFHSLFLFFAFLFLVSLSRKPSLKILEKHIMRSISTCPFKSTSRVTLEWFMSNHDKIRKHVTTRKSTRWRPRTLDLV